jgi:cytochrome c553
MPMGGAKLKDEEIADLVHWIQIGAPWPENKQTAGAATTGKGFVLTPEKRALWSLQPLQKPAIPAVKNPSWVKTPIDNFVLAKLEEQGMKPLGPADRRTLIRRVTYDLIGLPPTPEEIEAFENDKSADAYAKVIDRLLASPHYGERWARHWMDVARYAEGDGPEDKPKAKATGARGMTFVGYGMTRDGYANTWRYRDWLIDAFNRDMPYDLFLKAQIAADLLPDQPDETKLLPGLGLFGLGPWYTGDCVVYSDSRADERDTRVDVLSKGILGLTVTCARCHDHKYDPISQKDYYALAGIFYSSGYKEYNLAAAAQVSERQKYDAMVRVKQTELGEFLETSAVDVAQMLARETRRYMMASRKILTSKTKIDSAAVAGEEKLDAETLQRWVKYLGSTARQHPYLRDWDALMARGGGSDTDAERLADQFQSLVMEIITEKKEADAANAEMKKHYKPDPNEQSVLLPGDLMQFELFQFKHNLIEKGIDPKKYYVWLDVVQGPPASRVDDFGKRTGIFEYKGNQLLRLYTPEQKARLDALTAEMETLANGPAPPEFPYVMGLGDNAKPLNMRVNIRGNPNNLGDEVPRGFPAVLAGTNGDPLPFTQGSGRLQLAEAVVKHPITARVMANRIWMEEFGRGIVGTTTNFGVMGDRPSNPQLLEYLASRFVEGKWSVKALSREIMLSSAYQLRYGTAEPNQTSDPDNHLVWRSNLRRLDSEELRDSLLFAAGTLDERLGGPSQSLNQADNKKRAVYARIPRSAPNRVMLLFDFPDPNISLDQRSSTNIPQQALFFMNSDLIWQEAGAVVQRLGKDEDNTTRLQKAYRLLFGRLATPVEVQDGLQFLAATAKDSGGDKGAWQEFVQALLSSEEFNYID